MLQKVYINMSWFKKSITVLLIALIAQIQSPYELIAFEESRAKAERYYIEQGIRYYDPLSKEGCASSGFNTFEGELPEKTLKFIDNFRVKEKVEKQLQYYKAAEEAENIPWQIMAAIHFREGGLKESVSMTNGQERRSYNYTNIDNITIYSDKTKDAIASAKHVKENAKSYYNVDISRDMSFADVANTFLAYNRGKMYINNGVTYEQSPYVMNYLTDSHIAMKWIKADVYYTPTKKVPGADPRKIGKPDLNVGAMAIYQYLGGSVNGEAGESSTDCSQNGVVGDKIFPLKGTQRSAVTTPGMFKNNTTDQAGHPYNAFDIFSDPKTPVIAWQKGRVVRIGRDKCPGRLVGIYNEESNTVASYLHLAFNEKVTTGDEVDLGQVIGEVGAKRNACYTPPHLHFDVTSGKKRPGCKREACPPQNKAKFIDVGPDLYTLFNALPSS